MSEISVTKRGGRDEALDLEKLHKVVFWAVEDITGKSEEKGAASLFSRGGTTLTSSSTQQVNDFEVVSYVVVL